MPITKIGVPCGATRRGWVFVSRVTMLGGVIGALALGSAAHAGKLVKVAVDDMVTSGGAVVVATVSHVDEFYGEQVGYPATGFKLANVERVAGRLATSPGDSDLVLVQRGGYRSDGSRLGFSTTTELRQGTTYLMVLRERFFVSPFLAAQDGVLERVDVEGGAKARTRGGQLVKVHPLFGIQHLRTVEDPASRAAASGWDEVVAYVRDRSSRVSDHGARLPAALRPSETFEDDEGAWSLLLPYEVEAEEEIWREEAVDWVDRTCDVSSDGERDHDIP